MTPITRKSLSCLFDLGGPVSQSMTRIWTKLLAEANWRSIDLSTSVMQGVYNDLNHELALLQYKVGRYDMSITFGAFFLKTIHNESATLADVGTRCDALNGQQRMITSSPTVPDTVGLTSMLDPLLCGFSSSCRLQINVLL